MAIHAYPLLIWSVRRIGGKGEGIDVNSRSLAVSVRYATQSFGQSIVLSDA